MNTSDKMDLVEHAAKSGALKPECVDFLYRVRREFKPGHDLHHRAGVLLCSRDLAATPEPAGHIA